MPANIYVDVLHLKPKEEFPDSLWHTASKVLALKENVRAGERSDWPPEEQEEFVRSRRKS